MKLLLALLLVLIVAVSATKVHVSVDVNTESNDNGEEPTSPLVVGATNGDHSLNAGDSLTGDMCLVSPNGKYKACMQSDCNFVIYTSSNKPLWWTSTNGKGSGCHLDMQSDSNLVLYDSNWTPLWHTWTNDKGAAGSAHLDMQDDGNLVLYVDGHSAIWDGFSANKGDYTQQQSSGGSTSGGCKLSGWESRADEWVNVGLKYCGGVNGGPDLICGGTCRRQSNPKWDRYRSDCSGYVSYTWGLPAPGRTTWFFAPFQQGKDISSVIQCKDLQPGDAWNREDHVILFRGWVEKGKTAIISEESGCNKATKRQVTATCSGTTVSGTRGSYTTIRYNKC